jgi:hypothetical protein
MRSNLFGWAATRQHLAVALRAKQQRLVDRAELPLCMESRSGGEPPGRALSGERSSAGRLRSPSEGSVDLGEEDRHAAGDDSRLPGWVTVSRDRLRAGGASRSSRP